MIIPKNFKRVDLEHAPTIQALKTGFKAYKYLQKRNLSDSEIAIENKDRRLPCSRNGINKRMLFKK